MGVIVPALGVVNSLLLSMVTQAGVSDALFGSDGHKFIWGLFWFVTVIQVLVTIVIYVFPAYDADAVSHFHEIMEVYEKDRHDQEVKQTEIQNTLDETLESLEDAYFATTVSTYWTEAVKQSTQALVRLLGGSTEAPMPAMLMPFWSLAYTREALFNYDEHALYNLHVFLYDPAVDELVTEWRLPDPRIHAKNRTFKPGQGFVGEVYSSQAQLNVRDLSQGHNMSDEERKKYRSAMGRPIYAGPECIGAIIITSDQVDQFVWLNEEGSEETHVACETVSIMADLLTAYYSHLRK